MKTFLALLCLVCAQWASAEPALQWQDAAQLNVPRQSHAVAADGHFVYATGGLTPTNSVPPFTQAPTSSVEYALILDDGSIGAWQQTSAMTNPRHSHSAAAANGYLYVFGGGPGLATLSTSERAKILPDGSLGPWQLAGGLARPVANEAAVVAGQYAYLLGGSPAGGGRVATVQRAALLSDGSLGPWIELPSLPVPRAHHAAATIDNHIYVVGGDAADNNFKSVLYAEVLGDGSVGSWKETSPLTRSRFDSGAGIIAGRIYSIGGLGAGDGECASIETASILFDGSLGEWEVTTPMKTPRCYADTVATGTHLYAIAGYNGADGSPQSDLRSVESSLPLAVVPMLSIRTLMWVALVFAFTGLFFVKPGVPDYARVEPYPIDSTSD